MKTNALDKTPLTPGTCEWCGKDCEMEDVACCLSCEARIHQQEAVQGRMVLRVLKRWRRHRGRKGTPGEGAMTEVATMVDGFLRTDRLRRENFQAARRAAAAALAVKEPPQGTVRMQSAAPAERHPEEPEDGR